MLSMSFHPNMNAVSKPKALTNKLLSQNLIDKTFIKTSFIKTSNPRSSCSRQLNVKVSSSYPAVDPVFRKQLPRDDSDFNISAAKEKLGVVVKPNDKPRLVLKFIWMQNDIGIALDQMIPAHGTIPLSPYYFWPRKDAWEELKVLLESKPWISQMERVNLLNQATDIINLWQNGGGNL